jgi:transcriptional regulator with XRE-family HTH domain
MMKRVLDKLPELMKDEAFVKMYNDASAEFNLAREIIKARAAAGLSQEELARKMSTTQSAVARLESGRHLPSMSTLRKLAAATGSKLSIHLERIESVKAASKRP